LTRRDVLCRIGGGFGAIALSRVLADACLLAARRDEPGGSPGPNPLAPKAPHFPARAKRLIFLFMNGGPSHVDTFDPKPALAKLAGQPVPESFTAKSKRKPKGNLMPSPFQFAPHGHSGIEVSELYPELAKCIDDV